MKNILFIAIALLLLFSTEAMAEGVEANLISLDAKTEMTFKKTGDFEASSTGSFNEKVKGVYTFAEGVCNSPSSKGNLVLYYKNEECCLRLGTISDKTVATFIWTKPYGESGPHGICSNQVLVDKLK